MMSLDDRQLAEVMAHLVENGRAVRVSSDLFYHPRALRAAQEMLVSAMKKSGGRITTQELKDLWGLSRKYLIPLAEYFESVKVTARVSDTQRVLRQG
jgi:selenocysteine-specific elongation factor